MRIRFAINGSCPYWVVADAANIPELVLVDEQYVLDHPPRYVDDLKRECARGNLSLLHCPGFDRPAELVIDEPVKPALKHAQIPHILTDSLLRLSSGHLVCASMEKLPVAAKGRKATMAQVTPGAYSVEAFAYPNSQIEEQVQAQIGVSDALYFDRIDHLTPYGCLLSLAIVFASVVVLCAGFLTGNRLTMSAVQLAFVALVIYWLFVMLVRRSERFRRIHATRGPLWRSLATVVIALTSVDTRELPAKGNAPFVDLESRADAAAKLELMRDEWIAPP